MHTGIRIVTSLVVGVVMALLTAGLGVAAEFALMFASLATRFDLPNVSASGSGGLGAVSMTSYVEIYALIGFVTGVWWQFRRSGRTRLAATVVPPRL
jgi:hypothetical protein